MDSDSQGFDENCRPVSHLVRNWEQLGFVGNHGLSPTPWKISMVTDSQTRAYGNITNFERTFLTTLFAGPVPSGLTGRALEILVSSDAAGEHRFHYHTLANLDGVHRWPHLRHPSENLMPQNGWKGAEGLHDRAAGKGDVPDIRPTDPAQQDLQANPVRPRNSRYRYVLESNPTQGSKGHGRAQPSKPLRQEVSGNGYLECDGFHAGHIPIAGLSALGEPPSK
jgi:hypothetical protein